jgi:hypothetical protein
MSSTLYKKLASVLISSDLDYDEMNKYDENKVKLDLKEFLLIEAKTKFQVVYNVSGTQQVDRGHNTSIPTNCTTHGCRDGDRCSSCANGVRYVDKWVSNYVKESWSKTHKIKYDYCDYFGVNQEKISKDLSKEYKGLFESNSELLGGLLKKNLIEEQHYERIESLCIKRFNDLYIKKRDSRTNDFLNDNSYRNAHLDNFKLKTKTQEIKACSIKELTYQAGEQSVTICNTNNGFTVTKHNNLKATNTAANQSIFTIIIFLTLFALCYLNFDTITNWDTTNYNVIENIDALINVIKDILKEYANDAMINTIVSPKIVKIAWVGLITIIPTRILSFIFKPFVKYFSGSRKAEVKTAEEFAERLVKCFN